MRAVGYRQAWRYLAGQCGLEGPKERAIAATRQLAKRQLTWLRRRENVNWFDSMHPDVASMDDRRTIQGRICRVVIRLASPDAAVLAFNRYLPGARK